MTKPSCYYYTPTEMGLPAYPPGFFHLDESIIERVQSPGEADLLVCPTDIRYLEDSQILALPYLEYQTAARHVFFSLAEFPARALPVRDALGFRTDMNETLRGRNPNARSWCWASEDLARFVPIPNDPHRRMFDVHAQMWASSEITNVAVRSCIEAGLSVHDSRNDFFYGTLETANDPRLAELRASFLDTMQCSRLVLVPRSRAGVNRYRFFEALSMGRVPVLLGDDVMLPCADKIDYAACAIRIAEKDAARTGEILRDQWMGGSAYAGKTLEAMGLYGREMWARWLAPSVWERTWGEAAVEYLEGLNVS